jgi:hypothetical protein
MLSVNSPSTAVGAGERNTLPDKSFLEICLSLALTGDI